MNCQSTRVAGVRHTTWRAHCSESHAQHGCPYPPPLPFSRPTTQPSTRTATTHFGMTERKGPSSCAGLRLSTRVVDMAAAPTRNAIP